MKLRIKIDGLTHVEHNEFSLMLQSFWDNKIHKPNLMDSKEITFEYEDKDGKIYTQTFPTYHFQLMFKP